MPAGTKMGECLLTKDGGYATRFIAEEALNVGEVVQVGTANGKVVKNAVDSDMPIGVVYETAAQNNEVWIVHAGVAYVLPNASDTATRGYIIHSSSTTAGRASQSATLPAVAQHNREIGHFIETGSGAGAMARAILHWN